jgi:phospholipase C
MFIEKWAAANGYDGVHNEAITQWRRDHMSDLVNAFDFENVSQPKLSLIIFNL